MARDRRLTGTLRGQINNPEAPLGFEFSNAWKVISTRNFSVGLFDMLTMPLVGKTIHIES